MVTVEITIGCPHCEGGGIVNGGRYVDSVCARCDGSCVVPVKVNAWREDGEIVVSSEHAGVIGGEWELRSFAGAEFAADAWDKIGAAVDFSEARQFDAAAQ